MSEESNPQPEPKPSRWKWRKRKVREPYVEYDGDLDATVKEMQDDATAAERLVLTNAGRVFLPPPSPYAERHTRQAALDTLALLGYRGASAHGAMIATNGIHRASTYWDAYDLNTDPPKPGKIYR